MTEIDELPWCKHGINKSGYCAECKVASLITTIESQKEEIEGLHDALEMQPPKDVEIHERTQFKIDKTVDRLLIESLQKENERLVKFLMDFRNRTPYAMYIEMIDGVLMTK